MARTALARGTSFVPEAVGGMEIFLVTGSMVSRLAPTRAELDASTTLETGPALVSVDGTTLTINSVSDTEWGTGKGFSTVTGTTPSNVVIETWADQTGDDIRGEIDSGDRFTMVRAFAGDTPTSTAETWDLTAQTIEVDTTKGQYARVRTTCSVNDYDTSFVIPAAA